jgi:alkanesulfonate monooxygenase SsuD/methylene tetrahydromethanopterin reductase-like flavin-dependent oxidoreductase (luciferase family)
LYQAYGLSPDRRVARFNEPLALIKKLWTEDDFTFNGQFWQIRNASLLPKPSQKPHPPIWFGGHSPSALRRAVKYGSGFIGAGSSSAADFKTEVKIIWQALTEAKKDPQDLTIGKRVYLAIDKDSERAAKHLREWFGVYYGQADMADRVAVWGNEEECAERINEIVDSGARFLILNPVFDMDDHLEILAREIIPRIRGR